VDLLSWGRCGNHSSFYLEGILETSPIRLRGIHWMEFIRLSLVRTKSVFRYMRERALSIGFRDLFVISAARDFVFLVGMIFFCELLGLGSGKRPHLGMWSNIEINL
jgi:hypothetical protein